VNHKAKKILSGVVIGVFALPAIVIGGSVGVSLIQGKDVPESIQILAEQIDALRGRVEELEIKQQAEDEELPTPESAPFPKPDLSTPPSYEYKATGIITIYNTYSSSPQTLVKTTRFVSEGGKLFRTTKTIVVPGADASSGKIVPGSTTVEVIASEPGNEYNIGPSTFSIPGFKGTPKYLAFYGESFSAFTFEEIKPFPAPYLGSPPILY